MPRKKTDEEVKAPLIDEKKLVTIMKRFLGSKESDPDITKYYKVENGLHYMATTLGSAVLILFSNKYDGTFTKGTGKDYFRKPLPKEKFEDVAAIPEMIAVKDGKKTIKKPTGRTLDYPDIKGMFAKYNLTEFCKIELPVSEIDYFIAVHEAMDKASKIGGMYNTCRLTVHKNGLQFKLHDSPVYFSWAYEAELDDSFYLPEYYYDFSLMTTILKSLKDLKVDKVEIYIKDIDNPIIFSGKTLEYNYQFALHRKLVAKEQLEEDFK